MLKPTVISTHRIIIVAKSIIVDVCNCSDYLTKATTNKTNFTAVGTFKLFKKINIFYENKFSQNRLVLIFIFFVFCRTCFDFKFHFDRPWQEQ